MRIALVQCNVINGAMSLNAAKIAETCIKAQAAGASLCIVPFQAVTGPQPEPFAIFPDFHEKCLEAFDFLKTSLEHGPALLCGQPGQDAILLNHGLLIHLPPVFSFGNMCLGIIKGDERDALPDTNMLFQLDAEPFAPDRQRQKEEYAAKASAMDNRWRFYVNLAGGYESLVYNGQSFAIDGHGRLRGRGKAFQEDCVLVDMEYGGADQVAPLSASAEEDQWDALVLGTRDFVRKAGASDAVLGLSGGMDSALVACIATQGLGPDHLAGLVMPSPYTSEASVMDARKLADTLGFVSLTLPIEKLMADFEAVLGPVLHHFPSHCGDLTFENIQARIRGVLLMAASNRSGALVLNTGNKSELCMGYCTLYGDTAGAVAVIGDLFKTRVYELGVWYCQNFPDRPIPINILEKAPSAELRPGQKDTDSLPPYGELDPALAALHSGDEKALKNGELLANIEKRMLAARFKARQCPPPLLVG